VHCVNNEHAPFLSCHIHGAIGTHLRTTVDHQLPPLQNNRIVTLVGISMSLELQLQLHDNSPTHSSSPYPVSASYDEDQRILRGAQILRKQLEEKFKDEDMAEAEERAWVLASRSAELCEEQQQQQTEPLSIDMIQKDLMLQAARMSSHLDMEASTVASSTVALSKEEVAKAIAAAPGRDRNRESSYISDSDSCSEEYVEDIHTNANILKLNHYSDDDDNTHNIVSDQITDFSDPWAASTFPSPAKMDKPKQQQKTPPPGGSPTGVVEGVEGMESVNPSKTKTTMTMTMMKTSPNKAKSPTALRVFSKNKLKNSSRRGGWGSADANMSGSFSQTNLSMETTTTASTGASTTNDNNRNNKAVWAKRRSAAEARKNAYEEKLQQQQQQEVVLQASPPLSPRTNQKATREDNHHGSNVEPVMHSIRKDATPPPCRRWYAPATATTTRMDRPDEVFNDSGIEVTIGDDGEQDDVYDPSNNSDDDSLEYTNASYDDLYQELGETDEEDDEKNEQKEMASVLRALEKDQSNATTPKNGGDNVLHEKLPEIDNNVSFSNSETYDEDNLLNMPPRVSLFPKDSLRLRRYQVQNVDDDSSPQKNSSYLPAALKENNDALALAEARALATTGSCEADNVPNKRLLDDPAYRHAQKAGQLWQSLVGQHVRFPKTWFNGARGPALGLKGPPPSRSMAKKSWRYLGRYNVFLEMGHNAVLHSLVRTRSSPGRLLFHMIVKNDDTSETIMDLAIGCFHPAARGVRKTAQAQASDKHVRDVWWAIRKHNNNHNQMSAACSKVERLLLRLQEYPNLAPPCYSPLGPDGLTVDNNNVKAVFGDEPPLETMVVSEAELVQRLTTLEQKQRLQLSLVSDLPMPLALLQEYSYS